MSQLEGFTNMVERTPPCPKCRMTFRIGKPKGKDWKTRCHVCELMHYDGKLNDKVVSVAVDSLKDVEMAWR